MRCRSSRPRSRPRRPARGPGRGRGHRQLRAARGRLAHSLGALSGCRRSPGCAGSRPTPAACRCSSRRSRSPIACANTSRRGPAPGCSPPPPWPSARISRISRPASGCPRRAPCRSTVPSTTAIRRASFCRAPCPSRSIRRSRPIHRGLRAPARSQRRPGVPAVHQLSRPGRGRRGAQGAISRAAVSGAGAGPGAARSAAQPFSRAGQCGAAGDRQLLGGRGRQGRSAVHRRHRQAAIRIARRSAAQGAPRGHPAARRQSLHRISIAAGRARVEAGRRPLDPRFRRFRRDRPR